MASTTSSLLVLPLHIKATENHTLHYKSTTFRGVPHYFFYQTNSDGNKSELRALELCYIPVPEGHDPNSDERFVRHVATYAEMRRNW